MSTVAVDTNGAAELATGPVEHQVPLGVDYRRGRGIRNRLRQPLHVFRRPQRPPAGSLFAGRGPLGNDVLELQFPLHPGRIAGLGGRVIVALAGIALIGIAVTTLAVTGVYTWWHKRRARGG